MIPGPASHPSGMCSAAVIPFTCNPASLDVNAAAVLHHAVAKGIEPEGTTVILLKADAEHLGLTYEFPCRMITLNIHSSLEAVRFIARIATELAKHGMGVNPVSGFYHDHLFVPDGREQDALDILGRLAKAHG
jgi:hypothetical protein